MTHQRLKEAIASVPHRDYMFDNDRQVPQTTRPDIIAGVLELLQAQAGDRVLEIGTGSGYSTALLAELVGPEGHVTSIDVDREMVDRTTLLLAAHGVRNVSLICSDGRTGRPATAAFDRLVAWASSQDEIPDAWPQQVRAGGRICAPVRRDGAQAVLAHIVEGGHTLRQVGQLDAGFIPLTAEPYRPWEEDGCRP